MCVCGGGGGGGGWRGMVSGGGVCVRMGSGLGDSGCCFPADGKLGHNSIVAPVMASVR